MIRQRLFPLPSLLRAGVAALAIVCCAAVGFADTIRLRDGSIIRGEIVSFGDNQFTVLIGSGARGRRSRITLYTDDVESIEFDRTTTTTAANEPAFSDSSATNTRPATQPTTLPAQPRTDTASNNTMGVTASPGAQNAPVFETAPVRVRGDNTTNGWTNSGITIRRGQRLRITAAGRVTLGNSRTATPEGVGTLADSGKLMRDEPTGALIAVIGDNNDDFIFIGARREFTAQRDGILFLGVNEANLADNTGTYEATVSYEQR